MPELTIKEIQQAMDEGFEKQAVFINSAFQDQASYFDKRISDEKDGLQSDLHRIETKVDRALHKDYVKLEARVKRLEQNQV